MTIRKVFDERSSIELGTDSKKYNSFDLDSSIQIRDAKGLIVGCITNNGNLICRVDQTYRLKSQFDTVSHFCEYTDELNQRRNELFSEIDVHSPESKRSYEILKQKFAIEQLLNDIKDHMA